MASSTASPVRYRGRFAPTPSGPLHFGSLIAAAGSYLQARRAGGQWWLRIEDLDPPRSVPGAADAILRTLEAFGFEWDGPVIYQSQRSKAYRNAMARLRAEGLIYPCTCSRREIAALARSGPAGPVYPGTCRARREPPHGPHSWRLRASGAEVAFDDLVQGPVRVDVAREIGDFVLRRTDGIYAYHLALVVDDAEAGVTEVVRGSDLLPCTAPQILLQRLLGLPTPQYLHLPVAVNRNGQKLSKQTHAAAIDSGQALPLLTKALAFLGHPPPDNPGSVETLWDWAKQAWDPGRIPKRATIDAPDLLP